MPKIPIYPPFKRMEIYIRYEDKCVRGENGFSNIQDFVQFLLDNPEIAKELKYFPTKKK